MVATKSLSLVRALVAVSFLVACSSTEGDDDAGGSGTGGMTTTTGGTGSGKGGMSATGGSGGSAGTVASGGMTTTGGAGGSSGASTMGGAGATGGAGGSSGTVATGGMNTGGSGAGSPPVGGAGGSAGTGTAGSGGAGGSAAGMGGSAGSGATKWVATWGASPYYDSGNPPPSPLSNSVLRQVVHVSIGGSRLRVQFSNLQGNGSVTINSSHIALCTATPDVDSTIDLASDKVLTFAGMPNVTIPQKMEVWSDPVDFSVAPLGNVTITTAFGTVPSQVVGHTGSRTTSYLQSGSDVSAASMSSATTFQHWYYIAGMEVMAPENVVAAVAIGDSITDGRGVDNDRNNRWTDVLSVRLQGNAPTRNVAMINQGIGATNLAGNSGTAAQARFARDVLGMSGVKYAIVLDGVNDISGNASFNTLKAAYDDLIARAHEKSVLIYGGTITPFSGNSYYTTAHESVRQQVNDYVRSGAFDGFIDFDAAITDGGDPPAIKEEFATWAEKDYLHPGPAGYQAMGDEADLTLFTK